MNRPRVGKSAPGGRPSLVNKLADDLRKEISSGAIAVGEKLPTEAALTARHGVSRTVVREAVAALRADGMVEPRQGAGVFVINSRPANAIPFQPVDFDRFSSVIEMMELRAAVEIEAAALAAARRSPAQEEAIAEALTAIDRAAEAGEEASRQDLAFHLAIARATNNPRFEQFLSMLDTDAIPRARLQVTSDEGETRRYLAQLQGEHRRILDAITARDEAAARAAMRAHLEGGQRRYREFLRRRAPSHHTNN